MFENEWWHIRAQKPVKYEKFILQTKQVFTEVLDTHRWAYLFD